MRHILCKMSKTINMCADCGYREVVLSDQHNLISMGNFKNHLCPEGNVCIPKGTMVLSKDWESQRKGNTRIFIRVFLRK